MNTRNPLVVAVTEISADIKAHVVAIGEQIRADRSKIVELEDYVQSIFDIEGKHEDQFEGGQQSVALQVAKIIGYEPTYKEKS
jgi:hypothetical protein